MKNVSVNGTDYTGVSEVQLSVTGGGTANFRDVDEISEPSGSITITENGTHDVSDYAQAVVNVEAEGGDEETVEFAKLMAGAYARTGTGNKTTFVFPKDATVIRSGAFQDVIPISNAMLDVELHDNITEIAKSAFYYASRIRIGKLPENLKTIANNNFNYADNLFGDSTVLEIPAGVESLPEFLFYQYNGKVNTLTFKGTPNSIHKSALTTKITTINVPWAEGEIPDAPWGATNATINYNYTGA